MGEVTIGIEIHYVQMYLTINHYTRIYAIRYTYEYTVCLMQAMPYPYVQIPLLVSVDAKYCTCT